MPGIDQAQSIGGTGLDGTHVVWPAARCAFRLVGQWAEDVFLARALALQQLTDGRGLVRREWGLGLGDDADGTMEAPQSQDGWWFRCGSSAFHCFFSTLRGWVSHSRS